MEPAIEPDEGVKTRELRGLLKQLTGRVISEVYVINGRTEERSLFCSYDFDSRDSVEIVFKHGDTEDSDNNAEKKDDVVYLFSFHEQPGEEVEDLSANNRKPVSTENLEEKIGEALRKQEPLMPTFDDYLDYPDVQLSDLSLEDQVEVLKHDLELLRSHMSFVRNKTSA